MLEKFYLEKILEDVIRATVLQLNQGIHLNIVGSFLLSAAIFEQFVLKGTCLSLLQATD